MQLICRTRKAYGEADRSSAKHKKRKLIKEKVTKKKINKEKFQSCVCLSPYNPPKRTERTRQDLTGLK